MIVEEEARAAAYCEMLRRRCAYRQARYRALAGDPVAAARVRAAWQVLIDARNDPDGSIDIRERRVF